MRGIPGILAPRPKREAIVAWACEGEASSGSLWDWADNGGIKDKTKIAEKRHLLNMRNLGSDIMRVKITF